MVIDCCCWVGERPRGFGSKIVWRRYFLAEHSKLTSGTSTREVRSSLRGSPKYNSTALPPISPSSTLGCSSSLITKPTKATDPSRAVADEVIDSSKETNHWRIFEIC